MDGSTDLQTTLTNLVNVFDAYAYIFAAIDLMINTFHAYILSRKHMRTSSTNSILLGIALVDMVFPLISIKKQTRIWMFGSGNCTAVEGLFETNLDWALYTLRDDFRRCSTWLGLSLAAVRTIAVRNTMNHNFKYVSQSRFGCKLILSVIALSSFLSAFYYLRFKIAENGTYWTPPTECEGYAPGYTAPNYVYQEQALYTFSNAIFRKVYYILVGALGKFIPCILFPVFAVILIRELRNAKKVRAQATKDGNGTKKDLTTRLVIYMTVSFFVIEFPIGICFWIEAAASTSDSKSVATSIITLLNTVYIVMTLTHFSICFFMSTQYRRTVISVLKGGKHKISSSVVSVVQNLKSETTAFH
ncbi:unnamed protein product [Caenorhabditis sp. 36 PRJEB53466]|nr:unnamed protein product [Caenorhabditis sp. 36 PRJEB53466]